MIIGGIGGAKTQTGLRFEERTDLRQLFEEIPGYDLRKTDDNAGYEVWFNGELKAYCFKKYEFYRFLERPEYNINWKDRNTILIGKTICLKDYCPTMGYLSSSVIPYLSLKSNFNKPLVP